MRTAGFVGMGADSWLSELTAGCPTAAVCHGENPKAVLLCLMGKAGIWEGGNEYCCVSKAKVHKPERLILKLLKEATSAFFS